MRLLVYSRPPVVSEFSFIAQHAFPEADRFIISEAQQIDEVGLAATFNRVLAAKNTFNQAWSSEDLRDIRLRDRLLRNIPEARAVKLISAMTEAVDAALDQAAPDVVISTSVDSYVLDVLSRRARQRGIRFVGVISSFLKGSFRPTERGEFVSAKTPSECEVEAALELLLQRNYTPTYMLRSQGNLKLLAIRRWLEDLARLGYFSARRMWPTSRYIHHVWGSQVGVWERLQFPPSVDSGDKDWRRRIDLTDQSRLFYLPLQYFPEATVDYWCADLRLVSYHERVIELVRGLSRYGRVLIKEHPSFCGWRPRSFYKALAQVGGAMLIPASEISNDLIELCDFTVVWTGTVGFEAALKGTPVMALGTPYYASGRHIVDHAWGADLGATVARLDALRDNPPTRTEQLAMVRHVLAGTLRGDLHNNGHFDPSEEQDADGARKAAKSLRDFLDELAQRPAETPSQGNVPAQDV